MLELLEKLQDETPPNGQNWVVSPLNIGFDLLTHLEGESASLFRQVVTAKPDAVCEAIVWEAKSLIEEYASSGCGFGSSDMIGPMMSVLDMVGCRNTFKHGVGITIEEITIPY